MPPHHQEIFLIDFETASARSLTFIQPSERTHALKRPFSTQYATSKSVSKKISSRSPQIYLGQKQSIASDF
jgi:hypothetical protein